MSNQNARKIALSFFGPIMGVVGRSSDQLLVSKDRVTVMDVIRDLCNKYGKKFEEIALNKEELNSGLIVFVNGRHVTDPTHLIDPSEGEELQLMIASQMKGG